MKTRTRRQILTDPFSAHEALDRAAMVAAIFSDYVAEHAFVLAHPKLRADAEDLAERLGAFYQVVGQVVFDVKMTPQKRKPEGRTLSHPTSGENEST